MISEAGISSCKDYRWWLFRCWDLSLPLIIWIMMNPSTADHQKDDPTIKRVIAYSRSWGYGSILVINLYAIRCTDSSRINNRVGTRNDWWINTLFTYARIKRVKVIAAWGAKQSVRGSAVRVLARQAGISLYCLKLAKSGEPCHPLYLKASLKPFKAWDHH